MKTTRDVKNHLSQMLTLMALSLFLIFVAYVCGYFLLVRRTNPMTWAVSAGSKRVTAFEMSPDYRGISAAFFKPIHEFDHDHLRRTHWEFTSSIPWRESRSVTNLIEVTR
jgi:hypothetical protein